MRIGFVSVAAEGDRYSFSGSHYYMSRALEEHCGDVVHLGPLVSRAAAVGRVVDHAGRLVARRRYLSNHSLLRSWEYARALSCRLSNAEVDVLFAPAGSTAIALLKTCIPIVYCSDATFALMTDYYPGYSRMLPLSTLEGNAVEGMAIRRSRAAVFSSGWAADSAVRDYGADPERVEVVHFGANSDRVPEEDVGHPATEGTCRLLFLGTEWERKGGDVAVQILDDLADFGIDAHLTICGTTPPELSRRNLDIIGPLDKGRPGDMKRFKRLMRASHFLVLPTHADCTPVVFAEANAFGLPVVTRDTGGVGSVVTNGENGIVLPLGSTGGDFARAIAEVLCDPVRYRALRGTSRRRYLEDLNWDTWGLRMAGLLRRAVTKWSG